LRNGKPFHTKKAIAPVTVAAPKSRTMKAILKRREDCEIKKSIRNFQIKFNKIELLTFSASGVQNIASKAAVYQTPSFVSVLKLL